MHKITIAAPFVKQALAGAMGLGYDVNDLLQSCGISPRILTQSKGRISVQQFTQLTALLVKLMDDEAIGLLERPVRRGNLKMMGLAMITANSAGESWRRACQYQNLSENSFYAELCEQEDSATYRIKRREGLAVRNHLIVDQQLMMMHRFHTWLTGSRIPIRQVLLDYPQPPYVDEYRHMFYGARVLFNQEFSCIEIDRSALQLPNRQTPESLKLFLKRAPLDLLTPFSSTNTLRFRVRSWIEQHFLTHNKIPTIEESARQFGLSAQTLRRKLKQEFTSYQQIKDHTRRDWSIHQLNTSKDSIEQIASQLGFSEPSAFIRAFKSWTGLTPHAYRKH